ncbi:Aromatic-L-amino-acid decarboxylase [Beauveria bassiana]|uniref:Dopa decarboxylase (Aromatic L-amino acid decarboxylase) n=1 Tax=Beauveria bassiana (strain ARSEF 2860) TaxID=655819 RepID=J5K5Q1_BEAB2|nr:dopa decarboxylase (aromatic L-amino acid decarboxylase) [Beauveria bassiana ARSEF 2860]EJP69401.1 dopa decarboxylase (aromatic L-amino acid decarboxylase) [Beauveria bassiana ARSEF 2860]KAF1737204.1 Aromatic-L-amino-acid decarboxylase [Beauveria bassiana]KAH8718209.1 Aromatic-L-amino-acid decarboxylase [Beauveria bassiana]
MDINEYRKQAKKAVDEIADYYESIPSRPVLADVSPGYLRPLLPDAAPFEGESMDAITADLQSKILPGITHWAHPGFMAFFACTASHPANIAEMWSNAFNGAHFNWICSPAVTELETVVLDWLAKALALPECFLSGGPTHGGGVLHGSASEAIVTVMVAARDRYLAQATAHLPEGEDKEEQTWRHRSRLVALGSAGAHSSTKKAAQVLGVRFDTVPVDEESGYAMTGEALAAKLAQLRGKGLEPFYLTATFGSTDVCAVDDFVGIAATLAADNNNNKSNSNGTTTTTSNGDTAAAAAAAAAAPRGEVWVHVDGAFAGSALLLPEYQHLTPPFASFHSFNFNPHKWLLTTFDCSAVWVRSRADLITALSIKPAYLRNEFSDSDLVTDYRDWQIPLGRRFRSLKLWFVLRSYGIAGLRAHVARGIRLGQSLDDKLAARPDLFTLFTRARFALVSFRVVGADEQERNARTETLYETLNASGKVYLTSTVVNGKFAIRVSTSTAAVREEHVQATFDLIVKETEALLAKVKNTQ